MPLHSGHSCYVQLVDRSAPAVDAWVLPDPALDPQWLLELGIGFGLGAVAMAWIFGVEWIFGWIAIERIGPAKGLDLFSLARQLGLALGLMLLVGISEEILSPATTSRIYARACVAWVDGRP